MNTKLSGFTFIELLISIGIMAIFIPAIIQTLSFALREGVQGEQYSVAWSLAREAMESVYAQKTGWGWTDTSPVNGIVGPTTIGSYQKTVEISAVYRCSGDICPSGGTLDRTTRKITVTVTPLSASTSPVSLTSYVTQH